MGLMPRALPLSPFLQTEVTQIPRPKWIGSLPLGGKRNPASNSIPVFSLDIPSRYSSSLTLSRTSGPVADHVPSQSPPPSGSPPCNGRLPAFLTFFLDILNRIGRKPVGRLAVLGGDMLYRLVACRVLGLPFVLIESAGLRKPWL